MKKWTVLLLFISSGIIFANAVEVVESDEEGTLTVDNGRWKYIFRMKDNLLTNVINSQTSENLLSSAGTGARWIYLERTNGQKKRRKAYRQGEVKGTAKYDILKSDDERVVIHFSTQLNALQIEEVYTFKGDGTIEQAYEIEAVKDIPGIELFCWETKLGISGEMAEPFDRFIWGKGPATLRNESQLKTAGEVRGPTMRVSDKRKWIACYWIKPEDLEERFIALYNSTSDEYWMLGFEPDGQQPWFFLGDMAGGKFSQWFGFRVFGEHPYSDTMPTYYIEKGTKWSGTVGHIIGIGKTVEELSAAYENWQKEDN